MPTYLDDSGNPIAAKPAGKTYLDDSGNPVSQSTPGMEKLGGTPPPVAPVPVARALSVHQVKGGIPEGTPIMGGPVLPMEAALPAIASYGLSKLDKATGMGQPGILGGPIMPKPGTEVGLARAANKIIPSAERAGENFQTVMAGARAQPIDTTEAGNAALRANELAGRGSNMPKVVRDFTRRATSPNSPPITYEEGRDFASNAGKLSIAERMSTNGDMGRQVKALAKALNDANEGAAETAGLGDQYRSAMKEYRQAQQMKTGLKVAGGAALAATKAGAAYELARKALGVNP